MRKLYILGKRIWGFSRFTSDCTTGHWWSLSGTSSDKRDDIADSCSQMVLQLHDVYDPEKVGGPDHCSCQQLILMYFMSNLKSLTPDFSS